MIQIRHVPEDVHRRLKEQAANAGMSLSDYLLRELVREADVEWGQRMDERPHFAREGSPEHPDDPYTTGSVRKALEEILEQARG